MNVPGNKRKCLMAQMESALHTRALCLDRLELLEEEIRKISSEMQALEKEEKEANNDGERT